MHDAERSAELVFGAVRVAERLQHLAHDEQREVERQRQAALGQVPQEHVEVVALDVLHRDVQAVVLAPEVRHLHDVAMTQARGELGFANEHLREVGVLRQLGQHHLDDDAPAATEFVGRARQEDLGHAAVADAIEQQVGAEHARQRVCVVRYVHSTLGDRYHRGESLCTSPRC